MKKRMTIIDKMTGLVGLLGLIVLLVLTGCSSGGEETPGIGDDPTVEPAVVEHLIGFSAELAGDDGVAANSRASSPLGMTRTTPHETGDGELTTELLKELGFGVYCWYTEGNNFSSPSNAKYMLMQNQKVEWKKWDGTTDSWNYTPSKYWPLKDNEKLTFRAYAPYVSYHLIDGTTDIYNSEIYGHTTATFSSYGEGMPLLPVVVKEDDYKNGTQHDPLWGTGRLVQGNTDPTPDEYFPLPDYRYGTHYDNITYKMSGDWRDKPSAHIPADTRDGYIDWYFHHGMSRIMFSCAVIANPGCDKVTIKSIKVTPLYTQGLLDVSSPAKNKDDKPYWYQCSGDMTVELKEGDPSNTAGDLASSPTPDSSDPGYTPYPFDIATSPTDPTPYYDLLDKGLLIIPRNYTGSPMTITIEYTIDDDDVNVLEASGSIATAFEGNTSYTLGLMLTPSTKGVEINVVWAAFTPWVSAGSKGHSVYNW